MGAKFDPQWMLNLLAKKKRQNCADNQFLQHNGTGHKMFSKLLEAIGNGYEGKDKGRKYILIKRCSYETRKY